MLINNSYKSAIERVRPVAFRDHFANLPRLSPFTTLRHRAGWWISSGAITGVHPVSPGSAVCASFAGIGSVEALITDYHAALPVTDSVAEAAAH